MANKSFYASISDRERRNISVKKQIPMDHKPKRANVAEQKLKFNYEFGQKQTTATYQIEPARNRATEVT